MSTLSKNQFNIKKINNSNIISNYQLKQTIGRGGFAKVKRATHKLTGQDVAIKIIKKQSLSTQQLLAIKREINIHKSLIHQNIARVYQIYQDYKYSYIIMEYIKNGQIFKKIKKQGKIQQQLAGKIFCQIYSALRYMHDQKIMHRDIKVENIILDYEMNAKLIDFGLAQKYQKNDHNIYLSSVCGSVAYMTPQILSNKPYTGPGIDVWSLGVTLYGMIAGQLPFGSQSDSDISQKIKQINLHIKPTFSYQAQKLFLDIFKEKEQRISLEDIQKSKFYLKYKQNKNYNFVNTKKECVSIDTNVLKQIEKKYSMPCSKVEDSVKNLVYDQFHAFYYLVIQKNSYEGTLSQSDLNSPSFKKNKKEDFKSQQMVRNIGNSLRVAISKSSVLPIQRQNTKIRSKSQMKNYSTIKNSKKNQSRRRIQVQKTMNGDFRVKIKPFINKFKQLPGSQYSPQMFFKIEKFY